MVNRAVALIIRKTCQLWWFNWLDYGTEILLVAAPRVPTHPVLVNPPTQLSLTGAPVICIYMAHRVSPLLRKRVAPRMAKFFINHNMNKISIKHSGWQLYLSCIATRKKGWPYILHVRLMWSMAFVQTLRTLVLTFSFIAGFHMTSLDPTARSYRDFTFTMY